MTAAPPLIARGAPTARPGRRFSFAWLGVVPFVAFALMFLIAPTFYLATNSFRNLAGSPTTNPAYGALTFDNYAHLTIGQYPEAYRASLEISLVTAIGGGIFGFLLAYAVIAGGLPRRLRSALMTFCGVASNFAGIPLGLAFAFTLGASGILTPLITGAGLHITPSPKTGLELAYMYFQFPLMVLIIAPAIDGLRKDWREAAENMGATHVPVLAPRRAADPHAVAPRLDDPPVRERVRRPGDGLRAERRRSTS